MSNLTITYRLKGSRALIALPVPSVAKARRLPHHLRDALESLVVDLGEGPAARRYCQIHCTHSAFDYLAIHDASGAIERIV